MYTFAVEDNGGKNLMVVLLFTSKHSEQLCLLLKIITENEEQSMLQFPFSAYIIHEFLTRKNRLKCMPVSWSKIRLELVIFYSRLSRYIQEVSMQSITRTMELLQFLIGTFLKEAWRNEVPLWHQSSTWAILTVRRVTPSTVLKANKQKNNEKWKYQIQVLYLVKQMHIVFRLSNFGKMLVGVK